MKLVITGDISACEEMARRPAYQLRMAWELENEEKLLKWRSVIKSPSRSKRGYEGATRLVGGGGERGLPAA